MRVRCLRLCAGRRLPGSGCRSASRRQCRPSPEIVGHTRERSWYRASGGCGCCCLGLTFGLPVPPFGRVLTKLRLRATLDGRRRRCRCRCRSWSRSLARRGIILHGRFGRGWCGWFGRGRFGSALRLILRRRHYALTDLPAEPSCSDARAMRAAMLFSAALPHARGSYCFLLPTSPSIFSTPS